MTSPDPEPLSPGARCAMQADTLTRQPATMGHMRWGNEGAVNAQTNPRTKPPVTPQLSSTSAAFAGPSWPLTSRTRSTAKVGAETSAVTATGPRTSKR
jgi:hypothetical protein